MIVAQTERLIIRQLQCSDADTLDRIFGDPEVMGYGEDTKPPQWVRDWLRDNIESYKRWNFGMWAVVEKCSGDLIGYCGLSRDPDRCGPNEVEIGYRLIRSRWGLGLATEAVCVVREYGLLILRLPRLIAIIDPQNAASISVAEKVGFTYEREVMLAGYTHPDRVYVIAAAV